MSYADNPYSSPEQLGNTSTGMSQKPTPDAASRLKIPAIALLVLAPIAIIFMTADFGFRVYNLMNGDIPVIIDQPGATQGAVIGAYIGAGVDVLAIVCQIVVIIGAIGMLKVKSYNMAMTASVISVVPCLSACCVVGMPFGIWAIVILNDSTVKAAFRS